MTTPYTGASDDSRRPELGSDVHRLTRGESGPLFSATPWRPDDGVQPVAWPNSSTALRFELLPLSPPKPNQGPFVALSKDGAHTQVLLGRISAGGVTLAETAFVVQKDRYGTDDGSNNKVESKLARKRSALARLAAETDAGPRTFDVFAPESELGRGDPSPPLLFCTKTSQFLQPRCGVCSGVLRDCRSDEILLTVNARIAADGKPGRVGTFSGSNERYLHCPACASAGGPPMLYTRTYSGDHKTPEAYAGRVKNQLGLFRDMGAAMREARISGNELACATCEHRETCYPAAQLDAAGPAKQVVMDIVRPLSFHDFAGYVVERLDLGYDHAAQLIGGRAFDEIEESLPFRDQPLALESFRRRVKSTLTGDRALLYGDDAGMRGLEVLRAKLSLFADFVRGVRETNRVVGPHLDLRPENVMVSTGDPAPGVPGLWNLRVRILGAGAAAPAFEGRPGVPQDLFEPADETDDAYAAKVIRDRDLWNRAARVKMLSLTAIEADADGRYVLRADFAGAGTPTELGERDRVVAALETDDQSLADLLVSFRPEMRGMEATMRTATPRLSAVSDPLPLEDWQRDTLQSLIGVPFMNLRIRIQRRLHVPCDLHSAGVFLLRTLLEARPAAAGSAPRTPTELREAALGLVARVTDRRPTGDPTAAILDAMSEEDDAWRGPTVEDRGPTPWFSRENLFYEPEGRDEAAATVPRDLFNDAVLVALRLVSQVKGFSYASDDSDYDPARPYAKMDLVLRDLRRIREQVNAQMFGAARLNRDVNRALGEVRASAGSTMFGGGTVLLSDSENEARGRAETLGADIDALAAESAGSPAAAYARIKERIAAEMDAARGVCDPTLILDELRRRYPYVDESSRREGARGAQLVTVCAEAVTKARDAVYGAGGAGSTQVDLETGGDPASELKRSLRVLDVLAVFVEAAESSPDTIGEIESLKISRDSRFGRVRKSLERWFACADESDRRGPAALAELRKALRLASEGPVRLHEAYSYAVRRGLREIVGRFKPGEEKGFFSAKGELERLNEAYRQLTAKLENEPVDLVRRFFDPHFRQKFDEQSAKRREQQDGGGVAPTELAMEESGGGEDERKKPPKRR